MGQPLEDQMSWQELCEYTLQRIGSSMTPIERKQFRPWFMEREKIGYRFDHLMVLRAFNIWQELSKGLDHFAVITGREGKGKTTLAFQLSAWVNPDFSLKDVTYQAQGYVERMFDKAHDEQKLSDQVIGSLVLDEGTELLSRESLNLTNRTLVKTLFIQRALRFFVVVCIPNFFILDSIVRNHRVRTLIDIQDWGDYKCITGTAIPYVARKGIVDKQVSNITIKDGTFWYGNFRKEFPRTIDRAAYESYKMQAIRDALSEMRADLTEQKMIPVKTVAKGIGCTTDKIIYMIKKNQIAGRQIGAKFYVPKEEYERLVNFEEEGDR